jgi:hypothetical protein
MPLRFLLRKQRRERCFVRIFWLIIFGVGSYCQIQFTKLLLCHTNHTFYIGGISNVEKEISLRKICIGPYKSEKGKKRPVCHTEKEAREVFNIKPGDTLIVWVMFLTGNCYSA